MRGQQNVKINTSVLSRVMFVFISACIQLDAVIEMNVLSWT